MAKTPLTQVLQHNNTSAPQKNDVNFAKQVSAIQPVDQLDGNNKTGAAGTAPVEDPPVLASSRKKLLIDETKLKQLRQDQLLVDQEILLVQKRIREKNSNPITNTVDQLANVLQQKHLTTSDTHGHWDKILHQRACETY